MDRPHLFGNVWMDVLDNVKINREANWILFHTFRLYNVDFKLAVSSRRNVYNNTASPLMLFIISSQYLSRVFLLSCFVQQDQWVPKSGLLCFMLKKVFPSHRWYFQQFTIPQNSFQVFLCVIRIFFSFLEWSHTFSPHYIIYNNFFVAFFGRHVYIIYTWRPKKATKKFRQKALDYVLWSKLFFFLKPFVIFSAIHNCLEFWFCVIRIAFSILDWSDTFSPHYTRCPKNTTTKFRLWTLFGISGEAALNFVCNLSLSSRPKYQKASKVQKIYCCFLWEAL